jgi:hypothetical protein
MMLTMRLRTMDQSFCDWCYDELTDRSMTLSERLGLCDQQCCACESCIARLAYLEPPKAVARFAERVAIVRVHQRLTPQPAAQRSGDGAGGGPSGVADGVQVA